MGRAYKSKLAIEVERFADLLRVGTLLAIDPSSGSQGSVPGYAVYEKGVLKDLGTLDIPRGSRKLANRLYLIRKALELGFEKPDILAIELINISMTGGFARSKGMSPLMRSTGAIMSQWDVPVLEVAPASWRKHMPPGYVKSDAADAAMIGYAVYATLAQILNEPTPPLYLPDFCFNRIGDET